MRLNYEAGVFNCFLVGLLLIAGSSLALADENGEHEEGEEHDDLSVFDWIGHAIVSIIGLILAISILISGAKLTGRIKGKKGANTYKIHKIVSVLFSIFMIGTFFYGLLVTSGHGSPLLSSVHGWLGLIIFIFAVGQLIPCLFVKNRTRIKFSPYDSWLYFGVFGCSSGRMGCSYSCVG